MLVIFYWSLSPQPDVIKDDHGRKALDLVLNAGWTILFILAVHEYHLNTVRTLLKFFRQPTLNCLAGRAFMCPKHCQKRFPRPLFINKLSPDELWEPCLGFFQQTQSEQHLMFLKWSLSIQHLLTFIFRTIL